MPTDRCAPRPGLAYNRHYRWVVPSTAPLGPLLKAAAPSVVGPKAGFRTLAPRNQCNLGPPPKKKRRRRRRRRLSVMGGPALLGLCVLLASAAQGLACCPGRAGPRKRLVANSCRACGAWPTYLALRGRLAATGSVSEDPAGGREGGVPAWAKASDRTQSANEGNRQGMSTQCARNVSANACPSWAARRGTPGSKARSPEEVSVAICAVGGKASV